MVCKSHDSSALDRVAPHPGRGPALFVGVVGVVGGLYSLLIAALHAECAVGSFFARHWRAVGGGIAGEAGVGLVVASIADHLLTKCGGKPGAT